MVGVLALGPGLWLAGRLGVSIQGGMVLSGLVLVLWGVYNHWRGSTSHIWHEKGWIALTLSAGCAVWSLGNFGLQYDATWGLLPLMGTVYALLPLLYQRLLLWWQDKPHSLLLAAWAALALVLYGIGLTLKVGSGENYLFTFGGMAVVMVVRELFLVVEPRFRRAFPNIANHVYGGAGSLYFSGALVLLVGTASMMSLKLEPIAEQLAVVIYYCLVVGTVLEIVALRRARNDHSGNLDADARPIEAIIK
jgi:cation transport ATPase